MSIQLVDDNSSQVASSGDNIVKEKLKNFQELYMEFRVSKKTG